MARLRHTVEQILAKLREADRFFDSGGLAFRAVGCS